MSAEQLALDLSPDRGVSLCGYCDRPLAATERGDFACPHCAPKLALVRTDEEWIAFHHRERRAADRRAS